MSGVTTLDIAYPPSTNRLWRAVNGRNIKSEEYRKWLSEGERSDFFLRRAGEVRVSIDGPYKLTIVADRPDNRRRDLGNLEKPISDLLVSLGVVSDDCHAQEITLKWSDKPAARPAFVHVTVDAAA